MKQIFLSLFFILIVFACKKTKDDEVVADFTVNYRKINAGEKIQFKDKSRNNPLTWSWVFNGGEPMISEEQNPSVKYNTPGLYSVSLIATNNNGNSSLVKSEYIEVVEFSCGNRIIDIRDDKTYQTISILNRCWMKENLNTGTFIQNNTLASDNNIIEKYCYNNDPKNCDTYGAFYSWDEMMRYNNYAVLSICPYGFSVPEKPLFDSLIDFSGGYAVAGGKLKDKSINYWHYPNTGADDTYGFTALPSGYLKDNVFLKISYSGLFWTATYIDTELANAFILSHDTEAIKDTILSKTTAMPLRCVRNLF